MQRLGVVMSPDPEIPEEVEGVLNPAAARGPDGELYLFPRIVAQGNYSRVGLARVRFNHRGDPEGVERLGYALEPSEPYELGKGPGQGGCEDPRITFVEPLGVYVMAYVANGPDGPRVALAVSDDLRSWERLGLVNYEPDPDPIHHSDFDDYHNKDAAYFPRSVLGPDGRESLALMHRPVYTLEDLPSTVDDKRPSIWVSYCGLEDARRDIKALTNVHLHHVVIDPEFEFESRHIGGGTPPVHTCLGWLTIYHGVEGEIRPSEGRHGKRVRYTGAALVVDSRDPRAVLYRSPEPILEPETPEETSGIVNDVVFPTGVDDRGGGLFDVYYGMADERIGVARLKVPDSLPPG
jgi:predicted GH43/DUF377 family glycosyl hydrolase